MDSTTLAVVAGMSLLTYATKAGGLAAVSRVDLSERATAGLEALPGAVLAALLAPALADGGPPEWGAAAVVVVAAWRSGNTLLALATGLVALLALRRWVG